jgi:hypothetical protein
VPLRELEREVSVLDDRVVVVPTDLVLDVGTDDDVLTVEATQRSTQQAGEEAEAGQVIRWSDGIAVPRNRRWRELPGEGEGPLRQVEGVVLGLDELASEATVSTPMWVSSSRWYTYVSAFASSWRRRSSIAKWFALVLNFALFGVS